MNKVPAAISFPFRLNPNGTIATVLSYEELVRGQVIDALMTNQGERVFRPRYGCDIQSALFDPVDELVRQDAASVIKNKLENFAPRCVVRAIEIELGEPGMVYINIVYRPSLVSTDQTLQVPFSSEFLARSRREITA